MSKGRACPVHGLYPSGCPEAPAGSRDVGAPAHPQGPHLSPRPRTPPRSSGTARRSHALPVTVARRNLLIRYLHLWERLPRFGSYFGWMVPQLSIETFFTDMGRWYWNFGSWLEALWQTILIAIYATLFGTASAYVFSFLAARNLAPSRLALFRNPPRFGDGAHGSRARLRGSLRLRLRHRAAGGGARDRDPQLRRTRKTLRRRG